MVSSSSKAASKVSKSADKIPKKRGVKGDFTGARLKILEDNLGTYQEISKKGPPAVHAWFTTTFFPNYWETFHWSVPISSDSITGPLPPRKDEDLDAEQLALKKSLVATVTQKIKSWFNYRRNTLGLNSGKDPWSGLLDQIKALGDPPPRKPSEGQFYMQHPDFKTKVDEAYDLKFPLSGLPQSHRMNFRCEITQDLFDGEDDPIKTRLRVELEASHKRDLDAYHKGVWVEETSDPERRAEAIASISPVLQPLLDGIRSVTGLYCGFFAAAAPPSGSVEDIQCVCLTSGKSTNDQELSQVDPKGFSQATRLFVRSVAIASGYTDPRSQSTTTATPTFPRISTGNDPATPLAPLRIPSTSTSHPPIAPIAANREVQRSSTAFRQDPIEMVKASLQGLEYNIGNALIEAVAKLPPAKKKARISELRAMGRMELERADNIANNRVLMTSLGIKDASSMFRAPPRPSSTEPSGDEADYAPRASKAPASKKSAKGKEQASAGASGRVTRGMTKSTPPTVSTPHVQENTDINPDEVLAPSALDPTEDEEDEEAEENTMQDEETGTGFSNAHDDMELEPNNHDDEGNSDDNDNPDDDDDDNGSSNDEDNGNDDNDDNDNDDNDNDDDNDEDDAIVFDDNAGKRSIGSRPPPVWFSTAYTTFSSVDENDYGPHWMPLLAHWMELEAAAKFDPNSLLLTAKGRPFEVQYWIKAKRPLQRTPEIKDPAAFGEKWWKWWVNINPSWRHAKNGNTLKRGGAGSWEENLPVTGLNGFISVIVGLWFWREATPGTASTKWLAAVSDVEWTLRQLLPSNKRPGDDLNGRQSKRLRRSNK